MKILVILFVFLSLLYIVFAVAGSRDAQLDAIGGMVAMIGYILIARDKDA